MVIRKPSDLLGADPHSRALLSGGDPREVSAACGGGEVWDKGCGACAPGRGWLMRRALKIQEDEEPG